MLCPYCAEEIKDTAIKCKHCGEWLVEKQESKQTHGQIDNSDIKKFTTYMIPKTIPGVVGIGEPKSVFAMSKTEAKDLLEKENTEFNLDSDAKIKEESGQGQYSCPNCKSNFTSWNRPMGCAIMILIFISFGLGLIMIPFLPKDAGCEVCGHRWRV